MGELIWPAALTKSKTIVAGVAMVGVLGIAPDQWAVIGIGLVIGIAARWAYLMSTGATVTPRNMGIDIMATPFNAAIALQLPETVHLHDARLLLAVAIIGATGTMAFERAFKKAFKKDGDAPAPHATTTVFTAPGGGMHVPAGTNIDVQTKPVGYATPQSVSEVMTKGLRETPPAGKEGEGEMWSILRRLPKEDDE